MKKSVEMLKSVPSEKVVKKVLEIYKNSKWLKKGEDYKKWLSDPQGWDSTIQMILFLDPSLNKKVSYNGMGWFCTEDGEYGSYNSWEDPNYEPSEIDNYNELSDKELNSLISHSKKLKEIINLLNEE